MTNKNLWLLKFGAFQTILMGLYHFYIPFQYNWGNYLDEQSPTINWSLYSLNNYFSFNLLIVSLFLGYFLLKRKENTSVIKVLSSIILLFWIFSVLYQIIDPMPLPANLQWIGYLLIGVAAFNAMIFLIPLINLRKNKN